MTQTVEIPEYQDTELVAAEPLAADPAFWLAHLLLTLGDLSTDTDEFGVAPDAVEAMLEQLSDADRPWPVFRIPFAGGHTVLTVYANYEYENAIEFTIRHPAWGRLGYLGQYGPESAGPGLSWPELTTIAADVPPDADPDHGLTDPDQRLLLLLPVLGDAAKPDDAWTVVARALSNCGIPADPAQRLAQEMIGTGREDLMSVPNWTVTADSPIPVCTSNYSPRHIPLAQGITAEQSQALAEALGHPAA